MLLFGGITGLFDDPERDRMLDEQIAMGWGSIDQCKIPTDWRGRRGPEHTPGEEPKARMREGRRYSRSNLRSVHSRIATSDDAELHECIHTTSSG